MGSLGCGFLATIGLSASAIFLVSGIGSALLTIWAMYKLPETFIRLVLILFTHQPLSTQHSRERAHTSRRGRTVSPEPCVLH